MDFRKYNTQTNLYYVSGIVDTARQCNGFEACNVGDTIVTVNERILYPGTIGTNLGDARSWGGNEGEVFIGQIRVKFDVVAPGTNPAVEITQKFYVE